MTAFSITGIREGVSLTFDWEDGEFTPPGARALVLAWSDPVIAVTPTGDWIDRDLSDPESAWRTVASLFSVVTEATGYLPPDPPGVPDGAVA